MGASTPASATLVQVYEVGLAFRHGCAQSLNIPTNPHNMVPVGFPYNLQRAKFPYCRGIPLRVATLLPVPCGVVRMLRHNLGFPRDSCSQGALFKHRGSMADSAISNLLRKNFGAGLARVSLNKNIIRNYFSLVFSVDKRAFKHMVWFDSIN